MNTLAALALQIGTEHAGHGQTESWEPGLHPIFYRIAEIGPWIVAVLTLVLLVRAIVRQSHYRALSHLGAKEQESVRAALAEIEKHSTGEIVPVVLERSDAHPGASWIAAMFFLLLCSGLLEPWLPWYAPHLLLLVQIGFALIGLGLAELLPDWKRWFVRHSRATEMAEEQALIEFQRQHVRETRGRSGVLLFVSLFERRVIVLADEGVDAKVGHEHWALTRDLILAGIARGELHAGLIDGIRAAGRVLIEHFPSEGGGTNELANRLVVRRR
jgi:putative membrane protein